MSKPKSLVVEIATGMFNAATQAENKPTFAELTAQCLSEYMAQTKEVLTPERKHTVTVCIRQRLNLLSTQHNVVFDKNKKILGRPTRNSNEQSNAIESMNMIAAAMR
jgi:hypothetical protein